MPNLWNLESGSLELRRLLHSGFKITFTSESLKVDSPDEWVLAHAVKKKVYAPYGLPDRITDRSACFVRAELTLPNALPKSHCS